MRNSVVSRISQKCSPSCVIQCRWIQIIDPSINISRQRKNSDLWLSEGTYPSLSISIEYNRISMRKHHWEWVGCWFHHNTYRIDRYEGRASKEKKNVNSCVGWLDPLCVASREWVDMYKYFGNSPTFSRLNGHRVYLNNLKSLLRREGVIGYISSISRLSSIRRRIYWLREKGWTNASKAWNYAE